MILNENLLIAAGRVAMRRRGNYAPADAMGGCGVLVLLALVLTGIPIVCCVGGMAAIRVLAPANNGIAPRESSKVTLANFYRVKPGMTLDEVKSILGDDCELTSQMALGGEILDSVDWDAGFLGSCTVTFDNGRVYGKHQFGLR